MTQQFSFWVFIRSDPKPISLHPYVHCSNIYKSQDVKATECPVTYEWIKEKWYITDAVESYSAVKKTKHCHL